MARPAVPSRRRRSAWAPLLLACIASAPASCAEAAEPPSDTQSEAQRFLAGPPPANLGGRDVRFLLEVPRAFLPARDRPRSAQPIETAAVPFVARLADFSPAGDQRADRVGLVSGTVGWAQPGYVRRSVDGSWDNHFTVYNGPAGERYGLEVRHWQHYEWTPAELYISLNDERQLLIECADVDVPSRPNFCEMSVQRSDGPFVSLFFAEQDLPRWREIEAGAHRLVRSWIRPRHERSQ